MRKYLSAILAGVVLCTSLALPSSAVSVSADAVDPWAAELVNRAVKENLVPECLSGKDLRENITRAEFAAMAVKLYEAMSLEQAELPDYNPFQDTDDPEVLKAFELGIVSGMTANTFCGDELVTREQAVKLAPNENFIVDLIGLTVMTDEGEKLGVMQDVLQTGANDVYVVKMTSGKEVLLPAIKDCILNVDLEKGEMLVHVLDGLLDL